nr:preprotein translocase subunit YajC [Microlunatus sp. Gsoil 973]
MRPQRKRQQQQVQMMNAIAPGARVVTTTGIYATVIAVGEKQIVLETAPGNRVTMLKQAVGRVVGEGEEDASLASYRAGNPTPGQPAGEFDQGIGQGEDQDAAGLASGMAGGAPIQEYTPGSGPDFTPPADEEQKPDHETAPWPPYGTSQGSVLGESSLGDRDEQRTDPSRHTDQNTEKGNDSDR